MAEQGSRTGEPFRVFYRYPNGAGGARAEVFASANDAWRLVADLHNVPGVRSRCRSGAVKLGGVHVGVVREDRLPGDLPR